jgi:hypothetical protein
MKIKKNGKVIRLTESDLKKILKRVLTENYGYDEYIPNIQRGDMFRDTFNGDIFRVTDIQKNNPDGEGEDYETWVELENKGGEVVSFPHDYERGVRFNDVFTKVYLKPKYNYPPLDDIQLNEQEEYKDSYIIELVLKKMIVDPDTGDYIDTDHVYGSEILISTDLKDAEKTFDRKLQELKFFDTKGKHNKF